MDEAVDLLTELNDKISKGGHIVKELFDIQGKYYHHKPLFNLKKYGTALLYRGGANEQMEGIHRL